MDPNDLKKILPDIEEERLELLVAHLRDVTGVKMLQDLQPPADISTILTPIQNGENTPQQIS